MSDEKQYEVYRELFKITEWRDGCVFKTESQGYAWFDLEVEKANRPAETNLIYASPSDEFSLGNMTIRIKKPVTDGT